MLGCSRSTPSCWQTTLSRPNRNLTQSSLSRQASDPIPLRFYSLRSGHALWLCVSIHNSYEVMRYPARYTRRNCHCEIDATMTNVTTAIAPNSAQVSSLGAVPRSMIAWKLVIP